ncbi:hypothetical protein [Streptococcus sp.]
MNWTIIFAGVAAIVSVVNVFVSIRNSKSQMRAQIISSSRVQWIKEVRNIFANFIKLSAEFHNELLFLNDSKIDINFEKSFNMLRGNLWANYYQLISYFPDMDSDGRNIDIRKTFEELIIYLEEKLEYSYKDTTFKFFKPSFEIVKQENVSEQFKVLLDYISNDFSNYMKQEWEKAKSEAI